MPAYSIVIPKPRCGACGRPAAVTVYNHLNAKIGDYCGRDGATIVREYNARLERPRVTKS